MSANTTTTIASKFKVRYNKETSELVPVPADIQRRVDFRKDMELGSQAEFDVSLSLELGFTQGEGTLNGAIAQRTKKAIVNAYNLTLQSQVSYSVIQRAQKSEAAFGRFGDTKFIPMVNSMRMREEHYLLYGRQGLGVVTGNSSGVLTISEASWNPTLFGSIVGAIIEAWTAVDGSTQHNGDLLITGVDPEARTVTVSGTNAAVVANDVLFYKGDHNTGRIGLMHIAKNTGTLFNIDASVEPLWKANAYDAGTSPLTLAKILGAAGKSAAKGCVGQKLVCYVPVESFQGLVSDESALVRHKAEKKAVNGFEFLEFMGASGVIEVVPHLYMRDGESVLWPEDMCSILGSCEADTQLAKDGDIIFDLQDSNFKEMRMFSDTGGIFCERPGWITWIKRSDNKALHAAASA